MSKIFDPIGNVSTIDVKTAKNVCVTFSSEAETLIMHAPVTGIEIKEATDSRIAKALGNNFLLAVFGDQAVSISIAGLNPYGDDCGPSVHQNSIMTFYDNNKISEHPDKRIDVGIAQATGVGSAYRCAVLGLQINASNSTAEAGYYTYRIALIGVKISG